MATFSLTRSYCWCWWSTVEYAHTRYYSTSISTFTHRDGGLRVNATSNERKLKSNHLSNRGSDEENERTFLSFTYRDGKRYSTCSFAKKSLKKSKRDGPETFGDLSEDKFVQNDKLDTSLDLAGQNSSPIPSRSAVLQACTITSGLLAALGIVIRQVSHVASVEGLPILDCSSEVSFNFEMWHLELITGLVVLISSCRYLLLKTWADFAESSEAANQQVLSSLQPLGYMVVAFLPGISEELLFRGAILPLFGMNWKSVGVAALIFGVLHLGNGRKYSFAIWATFVGLAYGYATILSSSIAVPMASHAVNNLIGGLLWRCTSNRSAQK